MVKPLVIAACGLLSCGLWLSACGGGGGGGDTRPSVVPVLRANPGGPYQTQHGQNITFSGLGSTSTPFSIARYTWNCGQSGTANCDQDGPTPTFNYRRCGGAGPACRSGSNNLADYMVRLTITDTQGNTNAATTTVTVQNSY